MGPGLLRWFPAFAFFQCGRRRGRKHKNTPMHRYTVSLCGASTHRRSPCLPSLNAHWSLFASKAPNANTALAQAVAVKKQTCATLTGMVAAVETCSGLSSSTWWANCPSAAARRFQHEPQRSQDPSDSKTTHICPPLVWCRVEGLSFRP